MLRLIGHLPNSRPLTLASSPHRTGAAKEKRDKAAVQKFYRNRSHSRPAALHMERERSLSRPAALHMERERSLSRPAALHLERQVVIDVEKPTKYLRGGSILNIELK